MNTAGWLAAAVATGYAIYVTKKYNERLADDANCGDEIDAANCSARQNGCCNGCDRAGGLNHREEN